MQLRNFLVRAHSQVLFRARSRCGQTLPGTEFGGETRKLVLSTPDITDEDRGVVERFIKTMALSQTVILSYLLERGGRVKNGELVRAFTHFINCSEPAERQNNRDLFKSFVNDVAVVKRVDQIKYVVVKKKYQQMIRGARSLEDLKSSAASSCIVKQSECASAGADDFNNNSCFCTSPIHASCFITHSGGTDPKPEYEINPSTGCHAVTLAPAARISEQDLLGPRLINLSKTTTTGKAGTVFAVVAQISPAHSHSEGIKPKLDSARRSSEEFPGDSVVSNLDLHRSPSTKRRRSLASSSPAPKRGSKPTQPGSDAKDSTAIPLDPREHQWILYSATGRWNELHNLLHQDVHLAEKKSFISGFTALHWAAKHGNTGAVRNILDVARRAGTRVDVNSRSRDGYTALHIAAIHSHESVLKVLVCQYGANCNIRDNGGKKAYHYLHGDVTPEVRAMLGDPLVLRHGTGHQVRCSDDHKQHFLGVNTLSKLLKSSVGDRKKSRHRLSLHE